MNPITITLTVTPVGAGLPDADTNVLMFFRDGSACEGFVDDTTDPPLWRDVCADPMADEVVGWAPLPRLGA